MCGKHFSSLFDGERKKKVLGTQQERKKLLGSSFIDVNCEHMRGGIRKKKSYYVIKSMVRGG